MNNELIEDVSEAISSTQSVLNPFAITEAFEIKKSWTPAANHPLKAGSFVGHSELKKHGMDWRGDHHDGTMRQNYMSNKTGHGAVLTKDHGEAHNKFKVLHTFTHPEHKADTKPSFKEGQHITHKDLHAAGYKFNRNPGASSSIYSHSTKGHVTVHRNDNTGTSFRVKSVKPARG